MAVSVDVEMLESQDTLTTPATKTNALTRVLSRARVLCLCMFCPQFVEELWRRIKMEFVIEWPLFLQRWKIIAFGIVMQYVHGIFTQLAHRMHQPQDEPLHDVGFALTPELGPEKFWVSEAIFVTMFVSFVLWTFSPFVFHKKRFYTAVMWPRLLMVLVVCQALRILSFSATQLPGSSHHCRKSEPTAIRAWPSHWYGHVLIDVQRQATRSCGDLIFSSHTTFVLTGILTYNEYGSLVFMKVLAWIGGAILSVLIIASRKHYTVDIVIAWYTVPLVFYMMYRRWTTRRPMSEFLEGSSSAFDDIVPELEFEQVLPVVETKDSSGMEFKPLMIVALNRATGQKVQLLFESATALTSEKSSVIARAISVSPEPDRDDLKQPDDRNSQSGVVQRQNRGS